MLVRIVSLAAVATFASSSLYAEGRLFWRADRTDARLIVPQLPAPYQSTVESTLNGYLEQACGRRLPLASKVEGEGLFVVVGDEKNNPVLAQLVRGGLELGRADLGDEGFRILSHRAGEHEFIVVTANSPAGLKHGCQELAFFRMILTADSGAVDWPLDVTMKPAFAYRGVYMLPCWSAHDSIENWRRVLEFHSELTINRNWFWLGGFPLLDKYGGEYQGTDLASVDNVRGLVDLCRGQAMKFYIGDGWFTWHHAKAAQGDMGRGIQYYLDLLDLLPGAEGVYLEPVGEGSDAKEEVWREQAAGIRRLAEAAWTKRPNLEFAIAIGKFNSPEYRKLVHEIDDKRLFWWWCWGDPLQQNALAEHPLVLRWHTIVRMSDFHGSREAPRPEERSLTGFATSYDPGQGFGNPWNGWAKLGTDQRRDVHPHTLPLFHHQYLFRERCWHPEISDEEFSRRLARRLFDADMPVEAIRCYRRLSDMCFDPPKADQRLLAKIDAFVTACEGKGTSRNRDTLMRMREAVEGMRKHGKKTDAETR